MTHSVDTSVSGVEKVYQKIQQALTSSSRSLDSLKVLAVSKAQPIDTLEFFLKLRKPFWALGESYIDELVLKQTHFVNNAELEWHFLGRLQSRKIPELLGKVTCLHSVGRVKELVLIAEAPLPFFVQLNISNEGAKNGFAPQEAQRILENVERLNLKNYFLGLMGMPSPLESVGEVELRRQMALLRDLRDKSFPKLKLNMGTSADYEMAIAEGSNVIRLGSVLFGARDYSQQISQ